MNNLLLFFALPTATTVLASAIETILHSPVRVASVFFAIYLVLTFSVFDETFLIFAIIYTILAYFSAVITKYIRRLTICKRNDNDNVIETESATVNTINTTINTNNIEEIRNNNSNYNNCNRNYRFRRF